MYPLGLNLILILELPKEKGQKQNIHDKKCLKGSKIFCDFLILKHIVL